MLDLYERVVEGCTVIVEGMGADIAHEFSEQVIFAFEEAVVLFYKSETYKTLQETENGLWAESAEYIADRYYEEQGK